jgi:hypothetical protein
MQETCKALSRQQDSNSKRKGKIPVLGQASITKFHRSYSACEQFWRLGNPRSRRWQIASLVRPLLPFHIENTSLCTHMVKMSKCLSEDSFKRILTPFMRALFS